MKITAKARIVLLFILTAISTSINAMLKHMILKPIQARGFGVPLINVPSAKTPSGIIPKGLIDTRTAFYTQAIRHQLAVGSLKDNARQSDYKRSEGKDGSESEQRSWWRSKKDIFAFGLTLFGYRLWWSEDDICQTAKDFEDPIKWEQTKEYFAQNEVHKTRTIRILNREFDELEPDGAAVQNIFRFACDSFVDLANDPLGLKLISKIMAASSTSADAFIRPVLDNFIALATSRYGCNLINEVMKVNPGSSQAFVQLALGSFVSLAKDASGCAVISKIMEIKPSSAEIFVRSALDNFASLESTDYGYRLMRKITEVQPSSVEVFIRPVLTNFTALATSPYGCELISKIMEVQPSSVEVFIRPVLTNFTTLAASPYGCALISKITEVQPSSVESFIQSAADNVTVLACAWWGLALISKTMKIDPSSVEAFIKATLDNFTVLVASQDGCSLISNIMKADPSSVEVFIKPALDNFTILAASPNGCSLISNLMKANPSSVEVFIKSVLDNFTVLAASWHGCDLISKVMEANPSSAEVFIRPVLDNFVALAITWYGYSSIRKIMEAQPSSGETFVQLALTNFTALAASWNGHSSIIAIMEAQPSSVEVFVQRVCDNFVTLVNDVYGNGLIRKIMEDQPSTISNFEILAKEHVRVDILEFISKQRLKESITDVMHTKTTQTTQHFNALMGQNLAKIVTFFPDQAEHVEKFSDIIKAIVTIEESEQAKGNYTFVHAYQWSIRFLQDMDAELRSIVYGRPKQALSLRFIKEHAESTNKKHNGIREGLLSKGSSGYYADDGDKQKYMIFMNYALLSNQVGSNTLQYIANNRCENPPGVRLNKIFKHLGIEKYQIKYKEEIEKLERLHRKASIFGAGILFSFTPEMLKESVYVCRPGGVKRKVNIDSVDGVIETDDVQLILDTLRSTPDKIHALDHLEFVFVVTKDCALNPRVIEAEAYKTIPFSASDLEKYALYEQKRDELMAMIRADRDAESAGLNAEEIRRNQENQEQREAFYTLHDCMEEYKESSRLQE